MKKFFCCCLLAVVASVTVSAQITDSLGKVCLVPAAGEGGFARYIDRRTSTKGYRMTFIAAPLIVGGAVMSVYDTDFRRLRNGYVKSFHHDYDDYLQYAPAAVMLGLKAFGVKGRSSWGRMLVSDAFSVGLMAAAVNSLKYSFRVMRPDGSTRNSFPSGHTATVFMTATMLHKEYGHRSPWYSIGAYTVATVTGVTRQLNNRHWMSDVMVGAGHLFCFKAGTIVQVCVRDQFFVQLRYICHQFSVSLQFCTGFFTQSFQLRVLLFLCCDHLGKSVFRKSTLPFDYSQNLSF